VKSFRPRARIPSLDGLRAFAIVALLVPPTAVWGAWLFAIISAYAITTTMLHEHARTGDIAVGRFWMRRAVRLLPPLAPVVLAAAFLPLPTAHLAWLLPAIAFYLAWPMLLLVIGPRFVADRCERVYCSLRYHRFLRSRWFWPAVIATMLVPPIALALVVEWCVRRKRGRVHDLLQSIPAVWLGAFSYGLFLWFAPLAAVFQLWLAIPLALTIAFASHFLLERPALKLLRQKTQKRRDRDARVPPGRLGSRLPAPS
jgi:peptidoglycan/LPS O-acetylase OafA/YrhL